MKSLYKYIIFILIVIVVSGCTSSYNLIIDDDTFKEEININIENELYQYYPFSEDNIEFKQYPLYNNNVDVYNTKVIDNDNDKDVILTYSYSPSDFSNSNTINICFENHEFLFDDKYYEFNLNGHFNCLYEENININVITNNKVVSNNADSVNGNVYTWHINQENKDNISIEIKIKKGGDFPEVLIAIIAIGIIIIGVLITYRIFKKKNNERNEI